MEDQEKQANTVSKVVILVGCAFAALFVAMVVVMVVRGTLARAAESDSSVTYTMSSRVPPVALFPQPDLVTYTMSPAASSAVFVPSAGAEFVRLRDGEAIREAPVSTSYRFTVAPVSASYRFTVAPSGTSHRFDGTPFSSSYTFEGAPHGASFEFSRPAVYYHMSTGEKTVTGVDPKEKKK